MKTNFDETNHVYTINDTPVISGTSFINLFFPKFNSESKAKELIGSAKYPTLDYKEILSSF